MVRLVSSPTQQTGAYRERKGTLMRVYTVCLQRKEENVEKIKKKEREERERSMFGVLFSLYSYPKQNTRKGGPLFLSFFLLLFFFCFFSMKTSLFSSILFFSGGSSQREKARELRAMGEENNNNNIDDDDAVVFVKTTTTTKEEEEEETHRRNREHKKRPWEKETTIYVGKMKHRIGTLKRTDPIDTENVRQSDGMETDERYRSTVSIQTVRVRDV